MVVYVFNPSTGEAEAGGSHVSSRPASSTEIVSEQPGSHTHTHTQTVSCLKLKKEERGGRRTKGEAEEEEEEGRAK